MDLDRRLNRTAVESTVKFQGDMKSLMPNLEIPRQTEIILCRRPANSQNDPSIRCFFAR